MMKPGARHLLIAIRISPDVAWKFLGGIFGRLRVLSILGALGFLLRPIGGLLGASWGLFGRLLGRSLGPSMGRS
eukprot:6920261-Pyramimonas_sp.AAC.1